MYVDFQSFFTDRLVKLRIQNGISARKMSADIGLSKNYIAQVENRHNMPSMLIFSYICEYLNITPKEFFDEQLQTPAIYDELCNNLKELGEEQIINVNNIVKNILRK